MRLSQLHLVSFYRLAQFLLLPPHLATFPPLPGPKQMSKEKMEAYLRSLEYMIMQLKIPCTGTAISMFKGSHKKAMGGEVCSKPGVGGAAGCQPV